MKPPGSEPSRKRTFDRKMFRDVSTKRRKSGNGPRHRGGDPVSQLLAHLHLMLRRKPVKGCPRGTHPAAAERRRAGRSLDGQAGRDFCNVDAGLLRHDGDLRLDPRDGDAFRQLGGLGQCYTTFHGRNLRFGQKASVFVPGKPSQPSIMFAG
jgi:hypothetical protein